MKLINKISRYFFISAIAVFIIISVGFYFMIEYALTGDTDEQLINVSKNVVRLLQNNKAVSFAPFVEISSASPNEVTADEFKNASVQSYDGEAEPFRELISFADVNGQKYKIICRISLLEKEDLLFSILIVSIVSIFIFFLVLFIINKKISQNILKDFYDTVNKLENFSIKNDYEFNLKKSDVAEFEQLNRSILFLTEKAKTEYQSLKEFSEELNHEIQTPIAVVKSKLENILQVTDIKEETINSINSALKNLNKLERLNKAILLLNKLEHKDLFESVDVNIAKELKNVVESFNDFLLSKNISFNLNLNDKVVLLANHSLINILISNLISNSIKHNIINGSISIELNNDALIITNGGQKPISDPNNFFERFYKESNSSESIGLGLTIVKKICDLYGYKIKHEYKTDLHITTLNFKLSGFIK